MKIALRESQQETEDQKMKLVVADKLEETLQMMIKKLKKRIKVVLKHREYLVELHAQWIKDMT